MIEKMTTFADIVADALHRWEYIRLRRESETPEDVAAYLSPAILADPRLTELLAEALRDAFSHPTLPGGGSGQWAMGQAAAIIRNLGETK